MLASVVIIFLRLGVSSYYMPSPAIMDFGFRKDAACCNRQRGLDLGPVEPARTFSAVGQSTAGLRITWSPSLDGAFV